MAGDYQHYLQQMLQRGFKRPGSGKHPTVWVYQKNNIPDSPRRIQKLGAENHFYSPKSDGTYITLDDKITAWENARQADVRAWRNYKNGQSVDAVKAAELIGLTGVRTRAVRDVFSTVMEKFFFELGDFIKNPDVLVSHLNDQSRGFGEQVRQEVLKFLGGMPQNRDGNGEMEQEISAVSRMITYSLAENISAELSKAFRDLDRSFSEIFDGGQIDVATEHRKALGHFFDKGIVRDDLKDLSWLVIHRQAGEPWILPDCAVLNVDKSGLVSPFIFGAQDTRSAIILPLSPNRILIGLTDQEDIPNLSELDRQTAQCSNEFFIAAERSDRLSELCKEIGERHMADIDKGLDIALSVIDPFKPNVGKEEIVFRSLGAINVSSHNLDIEQEVLTQKANVLGRILFGLSKSLHISNLKKVIVCNNNAAAVFDLRDINLRELTNDDAEAYFYQVPYYDGGIAYELYVQLNVLDSILDSENEHFDFCFNIFLQSLWQIHTREILFQGASSVYDAGKQYERSELGVRFANLSLNAALKFLAICHADLIEPLEDVARDSFRKDFIKCLSHWNSLEIPLYGEEAECNRKCEDLMNGAEKLFIAAVRYFGACQAQNINPEDDLKTTENGIDLVLQLGLSDWIHRLDLDLQILYANFHLPFETDKVKNLQSHIERLFWGRGMIVFGYQEGGRILPFENRDITFAKLAEEVKAFTATLIPNTFSGIAHKSVVEALAIRDKK